MLDTSLVLGESDRLLVVCVVEQFLVFGESNQLCVVVRRSDQALEIVEGVGRLHTPAVEGFVGE